MNTAAVRADVAVIGGGLAGLCAALAAREAGLDVMVVRRGLGTTTMISGGLDFPGELPGLFAMGGAGPDVAGTHAAFRRWLGAGGVGLEGAPGDDVPLLDVAGDVRRTNLAFPQSMAMRVDRWRDLAGGGRLLFLGVGGYTAFQPGWLARVAVWRGLAREDEVAQAWVGVPDLEGEADLAATRAARVLDDPDRAERFASAVAGAARRAGAALVVLPPVLGLDRAPEVYRAVAGALGAASAAGAVVAAGPAGTASTAGTRVGELLSPPPSVPGLRLARALERAATAAGVKLVPGKATGVERAGGGRVASVRVVSGGRAWVLEAGDFVLATGKFAAGGVEATERGLSEPVFGLPVFAPAPPGWPPGLAPAGARPPWEMVWPRFRARHPVFEAGLAVDAEFRPLGEGGEAAFDNLRAAGSVIGGYSHFAGGAGSGVAVVTGVAAGRLAAARLAGSAAWATTEGLALDRRRLA